MPLSVRSFTMTKGSAGFRRDSAHFGILTGLDMVVKSYVYDIIYLAAVIVIFIIMVVVIRKKCKK